MKKLIVAVTTLILSASAMAGIQDKRIASHIDKVKQMNNEICLEKYPADFCKKLSTAFDGAVEMILIDGRRQGFKEGQRVAKK